MRNLIDPKVKALTVSDIGEEGTLKSNRNRGMWKKGEEEGRMGIRIPLLYTRIREPSNVSDPQGSEIRGLPHTGTQIDRMQLIFVPFF